MKLNIQERLGLMELLPREGGYAALKELRRAREIFSLTPEEIKEVNYTETPAPVGRGTTIHWDTEKETLKELPVSEYITDEIKKALEKLERDKRLSEQYFTLYEKFVL